MIICAAVLVNGRVYRGHRHDVAILEAVKNEETGDMVQGFLDGTGNFLNRREAFLEAIRCGQLKEIDDGEKVLISEDLY